MPKLKYHVACTGIFLGITMGGVCIAQNTSFPQDITILRNPSNPEPTNVGNSSQYLVYVANLDNLPRVKTVVPDAFVSRLNSGERVVQVGRFSNPDSAQKRVEELKLSGVDAQVQTTNLAATIPNNAPVTYIPIARANVTNPTVPVTPSIDLPDVPNPTAPVTPLIALPDVSNPNNLVTPLTTATSENVTSTETVKNRFFVIIPSTEEVILAKAQTIIPTARLSSSRQGIFIEIQGYPDRSSAELLNINMRSRGLDTRVVFF